MIRCWSNENGRPVSIRTAVNMGACLLATDIGGPSRSRNKRGTTMSIRYVERAMWAKGLGKTRKAVLIAIADAVSDNGIGWLLISSLMKKTDLSERAIQAAIAELCDTAEGTVAPILERRERAKRSSIFRIHLDRIPQHDHGHSEKEMTAEEMWGAGDAPLKVRGAGDAPHPRRGFTPPPQGMHPEPSIEPSIEPDSPLSLTGEAPPRDLLGDIDSQSTALVPSRGSLIDHVGAGWKQLAADFPRIPEIRVMNDSRKKAIARRAAEVVQASAGALDAYQVWDMILAAIRNDAWLRGESDPRPGYDHAYVVEIDHVLRSRDFLRILEKAATNDRDIRLTSDPSTGRRLGPAEQATHAALARIRDARERREGGGDRAGHNGR